MTAYHLCLQSDGRIVLDRDVKGELLRTIEVADPPMVQRWIEDKWQHVPAYAYAYDAARGKVDEREFEYVRGEGWFRGGNGG